MPKFVASGSFVVGQSQTNSIVLDERVLTGITISGSTITGTKITFLVSTDGTNFYPLYDSDSSEVSITTTTAARSYNLKPTIFMPWNYVKARLGTSASAVLQATVNSLVEFIMDSM